MADEKSGVLGGGEAGAEAGLEGGPQVFNRVEIRRIGRQKHQFTARVGHPLRGGRRLVEPRVVQHNHAAARQQHPFKIGGTTSVLQVPANVSGATSLPLWQAAMTLVRPRRLPGTA